MTQSQQSKPFKLSANRVDFGIVSSQSSPDRTITLTNITSGSFSFLFKPDQPWVAMKIGQQSGNDIPIILSVNVSMLSGPGRHSANLDVEVMGFTERIVLTAELARGGTQTAKPVTQTTKPTRQTTTTTTAKPTWSSSSTATQTTQANPTGSMPQKSMGFRFSLSLPLTLLLLGFIYGTAFTVMLGYYSQMPDGESQATTAAQVVLGVYLLFAFRKSIFTWNRALKPNPANPSYKLLYDTVSDICSKAGIPMPHIVLLNNAKPNIFSEGITPRFSCLFVNEGLLKTISSPDVLGAVIAHEIGHLRVFDTFYFSCMNPILGIVNGILGLFGLFRAGVGNMSKSMNIGPYLPFMFMRSGGWVGCLITLLVVGIIIAIIMWISTYVIWGLGFLLATVLICMGYSRAIEKAADLDAVRIIGDPDLFLAAMAATVDYFPGELAVMNRFAANALGSSQGVKLNQIVGCLRSGISPHHGLYWQERIFRSHPTFPERVAYIMAVYGTNIT